MKKDFSQPFEHSTSTDVDLFVATSGHFPETRFVLMQSDDKLLPNEFSLLSFEMQTDHDFDRQLAKYLYSKGLVVSQYRKLTADTYYTFSFIDDTPGQIEKCLQIYAIAEIADERDDLLYVGFEEFKEKLYRSSFVASEERAGLALLELQLGYKGAYRQ